MFTSAVGELTCCFRHVLNPTPPHTRAINHVGTRLHRSQGQSSRLHKYVFSQGKDIVYQQEKRATEMMSSCQATIGWKCGRSTVKFSSSSWILHEKSRPLHPIIIDIPESGYRVSKKYGYLIHLVEVLAAFLPRYYNTVQHFVYNKQLIYFSFLWSLLTKY